MTDRGDLYEGANWHQTRRHYAASMTPVMGGRHGSALCSSSANPVDIYDQDYHNAMAEQFEYPAKVISGLPLCKRCVKKAEKSR